ncbi:hypothetical protein RYX36_002693 [Vicia faba]
MKAPSNGYLPNSGEGGERKTINSELWHACAGPLVSIPPVGSLVVYFPQGHSEQVAASMQKEADFIPSYPNLPSKLICMLHNVALHADPETDEVYAQMTLQPVNKVGQPFNLIIRRYLYLFPLGQLMIPKPINLYLIVDFSMQPPAQEIVAKDLHDTTWTFRHIYRGIVAFTFFSFPSLFAGDSVLFIRDEKQQLLLGIKRSSRQQPALSSSVISSDSMHIGILAAAAHAASNNSPFTIFYNPRTSPCEFVIPLAKYNKALYTHVSLGMRFRMMFETEDSGVRRYMGTITGISDLDPVRWKNSQWRNLQVGWDESTAGERPSRVSIWDIEPVVTPFYICPPPFFRPKFPKQPGMPEDESEIENAFKRAMPWLGDDLGMKDASSSIFPGLSLVQWMSMQQNNNNNQFSSPQSALLPPSMLSSNTLHSNGNLNTDDPSKILNFQSPAALSAPSLQFNKPNLPNQVNQLQQPPTSWAQQQQQQKMQSLLQTPLNQLQQQQQHRQLQLAGAQNLPQSQQQQPQLNQHNAQQPQQQQQQQQQQPCQNATMNIGTVGSNQISNQCVQQPVTYSQLQQQLLSGSIPTQQNFQSVGKNGLIMTSSPQDSQFQQQIDSQQASLLQRQQQQQQTQLQQSSLQLLQQSMLQRAPQQSQVSQILPQNISDQQSQMQLLQKLQQQQQEQQQPHSTSSPLLQSQLLQQQNTHQQLLQLPISQHQPQQLGNNAFSMEKLLNNNYSSSPLMHSQQLPANHPQNTQKSPTNTRPPSAFTDGDAPSCSTSPSTNNCQTSPPNPLKRNQPDTFGGPSLVETTNNMMQELQSKPDMQNKHELHGVKGPEKQKHKGAINDQMEASSGTSYNIDPVNIHQNFPLSNFYMDGGDVHSQQPRSNLPFAPNLDELTPDPLLSRGYDSPKDLQNLLSNYGGAPRDIETELSTADISSQSFGVPNMSFKPGCSNDIPITDTGVLNNGLWSNQTQRMRTYTKVQKCGSVGRCIDVTRYKGYEELRNDLARMFGIEGQLEDPLRTDWKLVYVDHENDILLVGDDPWEEFVNCVQSIKILSSVEVQQMSLEVDLGYVPITNQACSGSESGNAWRAQYDDNSAASFNR